MGDGRKEEEQKREQKDNKGGNVKDIHKTKEIRDSGDGLSARR